MKKSEVYMLGNGECDKAYFGVTGRQFYRDFRSIREVKITNICLSMKDIL